MFFSGDLKLDVFQNTYSEMEGDETDYFQDIENEHANDDEEDEDEASINQDEVENENEVLLNSELSLVLAMMKSKKLRARSFDGSSLF